MDVLRIDKENVPNFNLMKKKMKILAHPLCKHSGNILLFSRNSIIIVLTFSFIDHFIYTHDFHLFHCIVLR